MTYFSVRKLQVQTTEGKMLLHTTEFELGRGQVLGVYGPNGAGKSSLLRALAGVNRNFQIGDVWIDGKQIQPALNAEARIQKIMYLGSDYPSPFEVKVRELLEMGVAFSANPQNVSAISEMMGLHAIASRVVSTLSDGERQWAMFARALIQNPQVLVLDESFSKLDLDRLLHAVQIVRKQVEQGMTLVVASHDLNFLSEISDEMILLQSGHVIAKAPVKEALSQQYLSQLYPELPLQVVVSPNSGKVKVIY